MLMLFRPITIVTCLLFCGFCPFLSAAQRPNILWLVCEDISPYLGSYGCEQAHTPNLDRLSAEGVRFTKAYANAPVCGVARVTLLTGMHAPSIGCHHMRSLQALPADIPAYPKHLMHSGYYTTNNGKTDYNSSYEPIRNTLWDENSNQAHWRNRPPGKPFFAVFNINTTHESKLDPQRIRQLVSRGAIPEQPRIEPADITLPPYHPDLVEIRTDWARLHDLITRMDQQVGERLRELEEAGEAENTIVFFYSDHGGMISRSKRYIYNVGTQVPFIARFPEKWRHLAPAGPGETYDSLVSFVDFPKTVLSLCGVEVPTIMQGRVFLGENPEPAPRAVHFYRDRMSERPDFSRAVTDGRFYFIRHFMPHRPLGRDTRYGNRVQANWQAWEDHFDQGKCDPIQSQFYQSKQVIELFDTANDPWHVHNLAQDPRHHAQVERLARQLDAWMIKTRDTGLIPEHMVGELVGPGQVHQTLYSYAQSEDYPVAELLKIAKHAAHGAPSATSRHLEILAHPHPVARYHGAYALFLARDSHADIQNALREMSTSDPISANRIIAAQALGLCGDPDTAYQVLRTEIAASRDGYVLLYALNALQYAHLDDRLTLDDWKLFKTMKLPQRNDHFGAAMAQRIISDAIEIFPEKLIVDGEISQSRTQKP